MTPVLRLLCAGSLLAAYYGSLFPGTFVRGEVPSATAATLADSSLLRDIDASQVAYTAQRYADALEPTRRLTEKMPSQALYFDRLAHIYHALGNRSEEARNLERLFAVSPTPADACPRLGHAYEAASDAARALSAFERCLEVDPENPDALLLLGRAYQGAGRAADARRVLERALALSPEYPDLYLLLGVRNYADGHIEAARQQFERFLALSPDRRGEVDVWLERTKAVSR
jgi:tetratricopeptide (TPR) repeat protein